MSDRFSLKLTSAKHGAATGASAAAADASRVSRREKLAEYLQSRRVEMATTSRASATTKPVASGAARGMSKAAIDRLSKPKVSSYTSSYRPTAGQAKPEISGRTASQVPLKSDAGPSKSSRTTFDKPPPPPVAAVVDAKPVAAEPRLGVAAEASAKPPSLTTESSFSALRYQPRTAASTADDTLQHVKTRLMFDDSDDDDDDEVDYLAPSAAPLTAPPTAPSEAQPIAPATPEPTRSLVHGSSAKTERFSAFKQPRSLDKAVAASPFGNAPSYLRQESATFDLERKPAPSPLHEAKTPETTKSTYHSLPSSSSALRHQKQADAPMAQRDVLSSHFKVKKSAFPESATPKLAPSSVTKPLPYTKTDEAVPTSKALLFTKADEVGPSTETAFRSVEVPSSHFKAKKPADATPKEPVQTLLSTHFRPAEVPSKAAPSPKKDVEFTTALQTQLRARLDEALYISKFTLGGARAVFDDIARNCPSVVLTKAVFWLARASVEEEHKDLMRADQMFVDGLDTVLEPLEKVILEAARTELHGRTQLSQPAVKNIVVEDKTVPLTPEKKAEFLEDLFAQGQLEESFCFESHETPPTQTKPLLPPAHKYNSTTKQRPPTSSNEASPTYSHFKPPSAVKKIDFGTPPHSVGFGTPP
ncbi:hypothetical protein SPRG_19162 [Saprolegnia parasitica CBS 223.65]|uniref:Uncharacterized protein n=1 Tax=Saprolegnia parasitica (strain CBS 223.65) TaxID=695850 RepID=A0A067D3B8_SAPPC|nr:hypothetical protein SPRG_19162 [Saprolegnia parasitica CBS 223.65]KDO33527.1 hypothetical protein SPRG_19162 [Saprolegnia parasitica CBS 223.65]|eukprot:XP_012195589.1 hypothetical protein SPRG_19162 [Saprolegnia parasitica CBS 223.65]